MDRRVTTYLYFKDPALLAERRKRPGSDNQKGWDALMLRGIYTLAMAWLVVLPLDASRFHWSPPFPPWLKVAGGLMLLPALYFIQRATMENTYLSTLVRIQNDRGHRVISSGVYGFVRRSPENRPTRRAPAAARQLPPHAEDPRMRQRRTAAMPGV
jgi:protein-S-isoprenylcysteine O-methyltransferase Ste14